MIDFNDSNFAKNLTDAFLKPNDSNNYKILEIERTQINEYIKDLRDIYEMLNLDAAFGNTLDRYGDRVGLLRNGATDEQYRVMLKAKIVRALSNGTHPSVIKSLCLTFNAEVDEVDLQESEVPCTVDSVTLPFRSFTGSGMSAEQIKELIETLFPITVTLEIVDFTGSFEFSDFEDEYDEAKGFADLAGNIGGYFGCTTRDASSLPM